MNRPKAKWLRLIRWWIILAGYLFAAGIVTHATLVDESFHFHDSESRVAFHKMVYGEAHRPFVYRALVPLTVRLLTSMTPQSLRNELNKILAEKPILRKYGYEGTHATEYMWGFMIMYISLVGFGYVMYRFSMGLLALPPLIAYLASICAVLSVLLLRSFFIYDYPVLFLFSICLLAMIRREWRIYYLVFVLSCVAKETAILLPLICFLTRGQLYESRKSGGLHISSQVVIWAIAYFAIRYAFPDRPGNLLEFHLFEYNLPLFSEIGNFLSFGHTLVPIGFNVLLVVPITVLAALYWSEKPLFLRRAILILVPLLGLAFIFGCVDETRMYYEALPIVFCLCLHSMERLFRSLDADRLVS